MVGARIASYAGASALVLALAPVAPAAADAPPTSSCGGMAADCPKIITTPQQGTLVTATTGVWTGTPAPTFTYQWQQCTSAASSSCQDIPSETDNHYVVPELTTILRYRVVVTATNPSGTATSASVVSAVASTNANDYPGKDGKYPPTTTVLAPGSAAAPVVGDTFHGLEGIAASPPTHDGWFNPPAVSTGFEWRRCDLGGDHCVTVAGATGRDYTAVPGDGGHTLRFRVTGTSSVGVGQVSSPASRPVTAAVPTPTPHLTLSGKPKQKLDAAIEVLVSSDVATTVAASGTLLISAPSRRTAKVRKLSLRPATATLVAGRSGVLELKLSKKALRACRAALANGGKVRAKLAVTAPGATTVQRAVRLTAVRDH